MKLIINASVLIAFYTELQKPELLKCLINYGYELLIPEEVMRELEKDANYDKISKDCSEGLFKRLDPVPEKELKMLKSRFIGLHEGGLGVIWWGMKFRDEGISNVKCVLDDNKARKRARKLGLTITGTLGILNILESLGILSKKEKKESCRELQEKNFRLPPSFIKNDP